MIEQSWERVHRTTASMDTGDYRISVWRLPIEGGWIYKLTEWTDDRYSVRTCFVPRKEEEVGDT